MKLLTSHVLAVGGGKGGVGKSFFAANIACGLAMSGRQVILVDADLAGANLHILFGIRYPEKTLGDFLKKKVAAFSDILLPTSLPNLRLICSASDLLEITNPRYAQKQKLIAEIGRLNADVIVIDIGAGASLNNLDFFNSADTGIIVTTPSPTSLQNAYSFLKMAVHRKVLGLYSGDVLIQKKLTDAFGNIDSFKNMKHILDLLEPYGAAERAITLLGESSYRLVLNMATPSEEKRVSSALSGVAYQYLNVLLTSLGSIGYDADVENSIRKMEPLLLGDRPALHHTFMHMANQLFNEQAPDAAPSPLSSNADGQQSGGLKFKSSSRVQLALHDEVTSQTTKLQVQTEDLGMDKAQIVTLVFSGGEILYSRKSDYREDLSREDIQQAVAEKVKTQHRVMIADINHGLLLDAVTRKEAS